MSWPFKVRLGISITGPCLNSKGKIIEFKQDKKSPIGIGLIKCLISPDATFSMTKLYNMKL